MPPPFSAPRSLPDLSPEDLGAWMREQGWNPFHALPLLREAYGVTGAAARAKIRRPAGLTV